MTILWKATEQYCTVLLFVLLHNVVLKFYLWIKPCSVTILWKATEQYCTVVLFVLLHSAVLKFYLWIKPFSVNILWKVTTLCFTVQSVVLDVHLHQFLEVLVVPVFHPDHLVPIRGIYHEA